MTSLTKVSKSLTFFIVGGLCAAENRQTVSITRPIDDDTSFLDLHQSLLSGSTAASPDTHSDMTIEIHVGNRSVYFGLLSVYPVSYSVATNGGYVCETLQLSAFINVISNTDS